MDTGRVRFFLGMGGNSVSATPDTAVVESGMAKTGLSVQISTKLNRSHVVTGRRALIIPTLGRTDRDRRGSGEQRVTVEDSMGAVHGSRGRLAPPAEDLLSRGSDHRSPLRARLRRSRRRSRGRLGGHRERLPGDPRAHLARRAGFRGLRGAYPEGAHLLPAERSARFAALRHGDGQGDVHGEPARVRADPRGPRAPADAAVARSVRHDDLRQGRPLPGHLERPPRRADPSRRHRRTGLPRPPSSTSCPNGTDRRGSKSAAHPSSASSPTTPRKNAAAYYPETNVLVPLESFADVSGTPTSKSIIVRFEKRG